jgi:hypothetical protein
MQRGEQAEFAEIPRHSTPKRNKRGTSPLRSLGD